MITVRYGVDVLEHDANTMLTVGTFDGVHCGHRGIIERMRETSAPYQSRLVVVTFDPHPQIVLQKEGRKPVRLLTTIEERLQVLEELGVHTTVVLPFSKEFAATPPAEFVRSVLVNGIGVRTVFIGHDHMFGKDRAGDEALLVELGSAYGFAVEPIPPLLCNGVVVSSTKIREALQEGMVEDAAEMLGRPYALTGTVIKGDGRGRTLGVPTANVQPINEHKLMPGNGIYAVTAVVDGVEFFGAANVGTRPTFTNDVVPTLEVHLFETDADLYGKTMTVEFQRFLRTEQKFDSKESLIEQMRSDIHEAQTFFQTHVFRTSS